MLKNLLAILFIFSSCLCWGQSDTVSIFFEYNKYNLSAQARKTIDSVLYYGTVNSGKQLQLLGYADYLGTNRYNDILSDNRSKSIQQYLIKSGIPKDNITLRIGKGEINRRIQTDAGNPPDRRVDIVISDKRTQGPTGDTTVYFGRKAKTENPAKSSGIPIYSSPEIEKIKTAKRGETVVLSNILFYTGRRKIKEESLPVLKDLVKLMKDNPQLKIQVEGHVCCVPLNEDAIDEDGGVYWANLSVSRALSIRNYLVDNGIDDTRVTYKGFGHSKPLYHPEKSEEQAQKNRRVEIRVLEN